MQVEKSS